MKRKSKCLLLVTLCLALALALSACRQAPEAVTPAGTQEGPGLAVPTESSPALPTGDPTLLIDSALDSGAAMTVRVEDREEAQPFAEDASIISLARQGSSLLFLAERNGAAFLGLSGYTVLEDGRPSVDPAREFAIAPLPFEGEAITYGLTAGGDGNFYLLAGNNDGGRSTQLAIQRYSPTGEYMDCMSIYSPVGL